MKIVHICQEFFDGKGYHENILPAYQAKLGHAVILITSLKNKSTQKDTYTYNGFCIKRIQIKGEFKGRFVIFNNLMDILEKEQPDYIYYHTATSPSLKHVANYKKSHPGTFVVVDNHGDLNNSGKNKLWLKLYYNFFWKNYIKKYHKYIDLFFGVSPNRCLFLEEELGVDREKIRLLPIGCDVDGINKGVSKPDFFNKYGLDTGKFIITHGGKITPEKEVNKILEAFMKIKADDLCLVLFGKIADPEVERLIKKDGRIKYIGWLNREDTLLLLKYSDLGIWHKLHTTLLEDAVSVQLPLILRYYGNTSHLIKESGYYLYEGSVREIQDKLTFVIHNRDAIIKLKEKSKAVLEILSYENIAKESLDYMNDLSPKPAHKLFMSEQFTDYNYENLRYIK